MVSIENFQSEVVDASKAKPIVLLFWAAQVPQSAQAKETVEALLAQYQDKVGLALSDVGQDQQLAQQLRIQGLPSLRVIHQGQIVEQVDGPVDAAALQVVLDGLTSTAGDLMQDDLEQLLAAKDFASAVALLQQGMNEEPDNMTLRVDLADALVRKGDLSDARTVLASIGADFAGRERPQNRLEFLEEAAGMGTFSAVEESIAANPNDLEAAYQWAVLNVVDEEYETALQACMDILRKDRTFRDDLGRTAMIRIFAVLGKGNELATRYRRKMFAQMH